MGEWSVIASVEIGDGAAGAMALGAVGIKVGAGAILERAAGITCGSQFRKSSDPLLPQSGIEQPDVVPGAELIVLDTLWKLEFAIHLAGFDAQHTAGEVGVANAAILAAGVEPVLCFCADGSLDYYRLDQIRCEEIGVGIVRAPFVGDAINGARAVADEEACFEPALLLRMRFVRREFEMFCEDGAGWKRPFARGLEAYGFRRAFVWDRDPTRFSSAVRPEGDVDNIGDERRGGNEVASVRECASLGQEFGRLAFCRFGHV